MITLPRDAFYYALLLKNLGQLSLSILDGKVGGLPLTEELDGDQFEICQDNSDGRFHVANYHLYLDGEEINVYLPISAREGFALMAEYKGEDYYLFDSKGNFMPNFGYQSDDSES